MTTATATKDLEALIEHCIPFLEEVKDMTTNTEVERWLNRKYGPDSELYQALACPRRLDRAGARQPTLSRGKGWRSHRAVLPAVWAHLLPPGASGVKRGHNSA